MKRKSKIQAYVIIKPEIQFVLNNSLLEGRVLTKNQNVKFDARLSPESSTEINYSSEIIRNRIYSVNYGVVISTGKFALSFIQNTSTELRKHTYSHEVGNISMYITL